MKLKVIDLLIKASKGEKMPSKIMHKGKIYYYDKDICWYTLKDDKFENFYIRGDHLNIDVQILGDNNER